MDRLGREVSAAENIGKLSIVGVGMRSHSGVAAKMFETLARENFVVAAPMAGRTVSVAVRDRLLALTEAELGTQRALIESRAARGMPRDTHGDLHLDHVYFFPNRQAPDDLVIIDCIEFNESLRFIDVMSEVAFLLMDLIHHGLPALASRALDAYLAASGDYEGVRVLRHYLVYRALVRAKVAGLRAAQCGSGAVVESAGAAHDRAATAQGNASEIGRAHV